MATSARQSVPSTPSSTHSGSDSPTETAKLMSNGKTQRDPRRETERWVFASPGPSFVTGFGRFHSPRIYARPLSPVFRSSPALVRSVSEDIGVNSRWRADNHRHTAIISPKTASLTLMNPVKSPKRGNSQGNQRHQTPNSTRPDARNFRSSLVSDSGSVVPLRSSSILSDIRPGGLLSRSSTRRSFGREWTRSHWEKVRDLEQESERARRCSKLSSGFAPLMVFGGLVFICIGVSAATNNGKDKERLKKLSAAPMAMGVFMLVLGIFLIITWFGCRGRAKLLEQRLLHGSRRNSVDDNLVQSLFSKLHATTGTNRRQAPSPTLPGVTLDGVEVLKPQPDKEVRRPQLEQQDCSSESGCCSRCGATNAAAQVILETAI